MRVLGARRSATVASAYIDAEGGSADAKQAGLAPPVTAKQAQPYGEHKQGNGDSKNGGVGAILGGAAVYLRLTPPAAPSSKVTDVDDVIPTSAVAAADSADSKATGEPHATVNIPDAPEAPAEPPAPETKATASVDVAADVASDAAPHSDRLARMPPPHPHTFTPVHLKSLGAVCEALVPPIPGHEESSTKLIENLPDAVAGQMTYRLKSYRVRILRAVLWLLSTRLGTFLLVGFWACTWRFPFLVAFPDLPLARREQAVLTWAHSRIPRIRALFKVLKSLACTIYACMLDDSGHNPLLDTLGYSSPGQNTAGTRTPPAATSNASSAGTHDSSTPGAREGLREAVVDAAAQAGPRLEEALQKRGVSCERLDQAGVQEVEARLGSLPELTSASEEAGGVLLVACDAVVVGSGCGGAVVASRLATARPGSRILILDKGRYYQGQDFKQLEAPAMAELYDTGGVLPTEDGSLTALAANCVGGGSTVNWSASFRTPPHVRREWAHKFGLQHFAGPEYEEAMAEVCRRLGVNSDNTQHNLSNTALKEGCQALGYPVEPIPRNAPAPHACGWCHFGCAQGGKQCTASTWLSDAAGAGATVLSSIRAQRVLLTPEAQAPQQEEAEKGGKGAGRMHMKVKKAEGRGQRVAGVLGEVDFGGHPAYQGARRLVLVEAPLVVVACGSLHTPALLLRSGLKNKNIGTHLRLHPVCNAFGYFPDSDPQIREKMPQPSPGGGGIMTLFSGAVSNWYSSGYGALIQTPCLHPGLTAAALPWHSKEEFKSLLLKYPRMANLITITRDSGRGRVYLDSSGQMSFDYTLNRTDKKSLLDGIKASLRILRAAGAKEVGTWSQAHRQIFDCTQEHTEQEFERFLARVEREGVRKNEVPVFSAHQLGSCPMGVSPRVSAVDGNGEAWEARGLFLGDGSLLPSPSGVNPMVTIESVAYLVGSRLAHRFLKGEFKADKETSPQQMHDDSMV